MTRARMHPWQRAALSPMQRTLRWLEEHGWTVEIVERWIPGANIRRDVWSCDVLACHPDGGIALVQVGTGADFASHVSKLEGNADARTFVEAGGEVVVMGWRELRETGWTPRIWRMSTGEELERDEILAGLAWQPRLIA